MDSLRMCVVCRELKPKSELLRVVKLDGGAVLDPTFKKQGRGAYICKTFACAAKARRARAFERSFSGRVDSAIYDKIEEITENG